MPFKSEKQRKFLYAKHPKIAKRWQEEMESDLLKYKQSRKKKLNKKRKSPRS